MILRFRRGIFKKKNEDLTAELFDDFVFQWPDVICLEERFGCDGVFFFEGVEAGHLDIFLDSALVVSFLFIIVPLEGIVDRFVDVHIEHVVLGFEYLPLDRVLIFLDLVFLNFNIFRDALLLQPIFPQVLIDIVVVEF